MVDGALESVRVTLALALSFAHAGGSPPPPPLVLGLVSSSLVLALAIGELDMGSELNGSRIMILMIIALQSKRKKSEGIRDQREVAESITHQEWERECKLGRWRAETCFINIRSRVLCMERRTV